MKIFAFLFAKSLFDWISFKKQTIVCYDFFKLLEQADEIITKDYFLRYDVKVNFFKKIEYVLPRKSIAL